MKDNLYNPVPGKPGCDCGQPPVHPCPPPMPGCDCGKPPVPPQCPPPCPPPVFPPFCPEDKPMMGKPCCPPPPMPPAPSVVSGMDLYEAMNHLSDRVNICIHNYNQVMAENYKALRNMQRAAEENGAYYGPGEVWVEEGYYPDESATYHIVHKACVDRRGEPIRMQLHLAYGNTTNSKIEQNIFSASKVEYADKMMVAIPKGDKGWYGKALWHGCPMPSADEPTLWTVGFTRAGVMRVYGNSVNVDQMLRDTVEDAMGVSGVLVMDGKVTDDSYRQYIPNAEQQTSRVCMGQNMATREVVILTVGNENDVNKKGLTSRACAEILRQYGCDIAVELCEGVGSGAMDKGSLMYVPDDTEEPTAYAYWFISRKCFYKNDYERELAELVQNYGACIWGGFLNKKAIAQVKAELAEEIQRAKDAEQQLQENIDAETAAREEADNRLQANIDAEAQARADADNVLQGNIDKEALARQNADAALQDNINKEAQARQAADTVLQGNIDKETEARKAADTALGQRIDGLNTRLTAAEAEIVKINQLLTVLQQQMTSLDATVTELAKTISDIETSLNNLKQTVLTLVSRVDSISETINKIISGEQDLPYVKRAGDTMTGDLKMADASGTVKGSLSDISDGVALTAENGACLKVGTQAVTVCDNAGGASQIKGVKTGTENTDAVNVKQLRDAGNGFVKKTGDTMTGKLTMGSNANGITIYDQGGGRYVHYSGGAIQGSEYVELQYLNPSESPDLHRYLTLASGRVKFSKGGSFTNNQCVVSGIDTPVGANDAVNKGYVDGLLGLQYFTVADGLKWTGKDETYLISGVMLNVGKTVMLVLDPDTWYPPARMNPSGTLKLPAPIGWPDTGLGAGGMNGYFCWKQASVGMAKEGQTHFSFDILANKTSANVNPTLRVNLSTFDETAHIVDTGPVIFVADYYAPAG